MKVVTVFLGGNLRDLGVKNVVEKAILECIFQWKKEKGKRKKKANDCVSL